MLDSFAKVSNSLDVSRDQHANLISKINDESRSDVFEDNSLLILDLTPKSTCQDSTIYVVEVFVSGKDEVLVCLSIEL